MSKMHAMLRAMDRFSKGDHEPLRYPAGWVPAMAPGPDPDDSEADYARESVTVDCDFCGTTVNVTSANYDELTHEWVCDECAAEIDHLAR